MQDVPRTPERREDPSLPRSAASFRTQRKLVDTPSSARLVERCLSDLDQMIKDDSTAKDIAPKMIEDSCKPDTNSNPRPSSPEQPSNMSRSIQSAMKQLDFVITQRKKELSDIYRSGGNRSTQKKKIRRVETTGSTMELQSSARRFLQFEASEGSLLGDSESTSKAVTKALSASKSCASFTSPSKSPESAHTNRTTPLTEHRPVANTSRAVQDLEIEELASPPLRPLPAAMAVVAAQRGQVGDGSPFDAEIGAVRVQTSSVSPQSIDADGATQWDAIAADLDTGDPDEYADSLGRRLLDNLSPIMKAIQDSAAIPASPPRDDLESRSVFYKKMINKIERSLNQSEPGAYAFDLDAEGDAIDLEREDDHDQTTVSSEDAYEKVMHDNDVSYDHAANVYYTSPEPVQDCAGIAEAKDEAPLYALSPDSVHPSDLSHPHPHAHSRVPVNGLQSPEVLMGDIYGDERDAESSFCGANSATPSAEGAHPRDMFDNEEAAQLLKYKLNLKNEILKRQVNEIAAWLETEYLERNNRFKTLVEENQRILAQKMLLEDDLSSAQEELLFVRSQLQNKSAKVLDLDTELDAQVKVSAALQAEADTLREELRQGTERAWMTAHDSTDAADERPAGPVERELREALLAKEADLEELSRQYTVLAEDFDKVTTAFAAVAADEETTQRQAAAAHRESEERAAECARWRSVAEQTQQACEELSRDLAAARKKARVRSSDAARQTQVAVVRVNAPASRGSAALVLVLLAAIWALLLVVAYLFLLLDQHGSAPAYRITS